MFEVSPMNRTKGVVIARCFGGLGNQLFIYAAAKRLALTNNAQLRLDIRSGFEQDNPFENHYSLRHFNIDDPIASEEESYLGINGPKRRYWSRKISSFLPFQKRFHIKHEGGFEPRLLSRKVTGKLYLQGYWQDERYFKDIKEIIRQKFKIVTPHESTTLEFEQKIKSSNAVCLHARRKNYEHAISEDYYNKAIDFIAARVSNPHFFCFSDAPEWFAKNLRIDHPFTVVDANDDQKDYEDLYLMTLCNHYILANSTFSWWGAWLGDNPDKIVVAPEKWGYDTTIPKEWTAMS